MTSRERIEATLHRRDVDRIPFWPKFTEVYRFYQRSHWRNCSLMDMYGYIGTDTVVLEWPSIITVPCAGMSVTEDKSSGTVIYDTGSRKLVARFIVTDEVRESQISEYPVKNVDDIRAMTRFYKSAKFKINDKPDEGSNNEFRMVSMHTSPLMDLCQNLAGLENTIFFLADWPDETEELIATLQAANTMKLRLLCENTVCGYVLCPENTSTTLINPKMFERYCLPHLLEYGDIIRSFGKWQILHMCGKLKALLPLIERIPALAMEAFTAPTVGDTTIADGFKFLPGKAIIGGTGATTWMKPEKAAIECILNDIREAGSTRGLFLTSAGVMPYSAGVEKIKTIWDGVREGLYGAR